jgi:hypothetical protein
MMDQIGYLKNFNNIEYIIERIFTKPLVMYSNDTYQFDDYSKYKMEIFSEEEKAEHRRTQFPLDCQKAFQLAVKLIK